MLFLDIFDPFLVSIVSPFFFFLLSLSCIPPPTPLSSFHLIPPWASQIFFFSPIISTPPTLVSPMTNFTLRTFKGSWNSPSSYCIDVVWECFSFPIVLAQTFLPPHLVLPSFTFSCDLFFFVPVVLLVTSAADLSPSYFTFFFYFLDRLPGCVFFHTFVVLSLFLLLILQ